MLTSWSEQSTPAELSIASVLMRPPAGRVLDAAALGEARGCRPRRRRARAARAPSTRSASLSRSPTSACVSSGGLDERADAAVPEQVDRCAQDRLAQLVGVERSAVDAESGPRLGRERHRLLRARPHAAAGARSGRGRSRPTTCRHRARTGAAARRTTAAASGDGSRKTWRWSNAATSWIWRDSSMPLPKTSPDMSPIPTTVNGRESTSRPSSRKWRLTLSQAPRR